MLSNTENGTHNENGTPPGIVSDVCDIRLVTSSHVTRQRVKRDEVTVTSVTYPWLWLTLPKFSTSTDKSIEVGFDYYVVNID
jgi:hypothetical protein